jgi:hypothetical protein
LFEGDERQPFLNLLNIGNGLLNHYDNLVINLQNRFSLNNQTGERKDDSPPVLKIADEVMEEMLT